MQQEEKLQGSRTLTDDDINALAIALERRIEKKFYHDLGKGLWGLVWKIAIAFLVFIAAQGVNFKWWKP